MVEPPEQVDSGEGDDSIKNRFPPTPYCAMTIGYKQNRFRGVSE